jgi:transcriptional regulator with XRE-family HTH domain
MSRRRAGLTQRQLAERLGLRQATIARWERGDRRPSFEDAKAAARACGFDIDAHVVAEDRSWWPQIAGQLELDPLTRVRRLTPPGSIDLAGHVRALAESESSLIVIGELAGALHGWPLVLGTNTVEVCSRPDTRPALTTALAVVETPPGTWGYGDLARGAEVIELGEGTVRVAGLLDLLRIADASSGRDARRHALALRTVIDFLEARSQASETRDLSDAERIASWLGQQSPVR